MLGKEYMKLLVMQFSVTPYSPPKVSRRFGASKQAGIKIIQL
jgi:hypothetical protein